MVLRIVNGELWAGPSPEELVYVGPAHMSHITQNGNRGHQIEFDSDGEAELDLTMVRWKQNFLRN